MSQFEDNQFSDHAVESAIDDAMHTLPLVAPPPSLYPAVMAQIDTANRLPRFQLGWISWAFGILFASMAGALVLSWEYVSFHLPTQITIDFDQFKAIETFVVAQSQNSVVLWSVLGGIGILFVTAVAALISSWERPMA